MADDVEGCTKTNFKTSYGSHAQPKRFKFDWTFVKRFLRVLSIIFPSCCCVASLILIFMLLVSLLEQVIIYNIGLIPSKYYIVLGVKDRSGFNHETLMAVIFIVSEAFVNSTLQYLGSLLYITGRGSLCSTLQNKYLQDIVYYQINIVHKCIDNPDQRITQDVDKLCLSFSKVFTKTIISPFTISYYMYQASVSTGYIGPLSVLVFFVVGSALNKFLMSPVVDYVFRRERLEGDFRFKHMELRVNAESAAFHRSGSLEALKTNSKLHSLLEVQKMLIRKEYALNFSIKLCDYVGSILSYMSLALPIFLGAYDSLSPVDLSALISKNAFVTIYLISCFTQLIDLSKEVADMAGTTHRVGELLEELLARQTDQRTDRGVDYDSSTAYQISGNEDRRLITTAFFAENLTYGPPKSSKILCSNLTFRLEAGVNILVTGDSGSGKTSLLRIINRLWEPVSGCVKTFLPFGPRGIFFLPQRPYFTNGSLLEQVIYPLKEVNPNTVSTDDRRVTEFLDVVGLNDLVGRTGGLETVMDWNWYDVMSPGEMQRLSFARLFFHQPQFALVDEATSQIGLDAERQMYATCHELGITMMSVGHRESLRNYHQQELWISQATMWSMKPICQNSGL